MRVPGGQLAPGSLAALGAVAARHGDGQVQLTSRANLQLRGLPAGDGCLGPDLVREVEATGLLPTRSHELVRNVLASPLTGLSGGRADLRPMVTSLDAGLCAAPELAELSARTLFVLDDGRGDLAGRRADFGLVALDDRTVQLTVGDHWDEVVASEDAVDQLLALARDFVTARGTGPTAPWHVRELASPLRPAQLPDPRVMVAAEAPPCGPVPGTAGKVEYVGVPDGVIGPSLLAVLTAPGVQHLVLTPWQRVVVVRT